MSKTKHTALQYWDERSELFGNYYLKPSWFDKHFRKAVYTRVAVAVKVCKNLNQPTVLDIGSGPGVNSVTILKNTSTKHLTGIDFAPSMIEYAQDIVKKEGVESKATFVEGDFMDYNWRNQAFDVSIALGVLDYTKEAQAFTKKMSQVTNKAFVISWPENGLRMALRRYRYTCPLYHYTAQDIVSIHEQAGISKDKLELIEVPGGWVTIARK